MADVGSDGLGVAVALDGDNDTDNAVMASFWICINRQRGQSHGLAGLGGVYSRWGLRTLIGLGRASVSVIAACTVS